MEEIPKPTENELAKEFSRKVQEFKKTEFYSLLTQKLDQDFRRNVNDLIEKEDEQARGAIIYIKELKSWFDGKSDEEELITIIEKKEDW